MMPMILYRSILLVMLTLKQSCALEGKASQMMSSGRGIRGATTRGFVASTRSKKTPPSMSMKYGMTYAPAMMMAPYGMTPAPTHTKTPVPQPDVSVTTCPLVTKAGQGLQDQKFQVDVKKTSGIIPITYDFFDVKDRLVVRYQGKIIKDTGFKSGSATVNVPFSGSSTLIEITIDANDADSNTAWELTVGCPDVPTLDCPFVTEAGQGLQDETFFVDVQTTSGTIPITYDFFDISDRLIVRYQDKIIKDTGFKSGSATVNVPFSGSSTIIEVTIDANDADSNTAWELTVGCPDVPTLDCPFVTEAAQGLQDETFFVDVQMTSGIIPIMYNFFDISDRLIVRYEGDIIKDTGFKSGSATINVPFSGMSALIEVTIDSNDSDSSTAWELTVGCPTKE